MGSLDADLDEAMRQAMGLAPSKANAEPMAIALATPMGRRAKAGLDAELDEAMRQAAGLPPTIKAQPGVAFSQDGGTDLISPETAAQSSPVSRSDFERTLRITLFGADVKGSPEQEKSLNAIVSRRREEDARKQEKEALVSRIDQHVRAALARRRAEGGITGFSDAEIDAIAQAAAEASIATERTQAIRNVAQRTGMSVANLEKLLQRSRDEAERGRFLTAGLPKRFRLDPGVSFEFLGTRFGRADGGRPARAAVSEGTDQGWPVHQAGRWAPVHR